MMFRRNFIEWPTVFLLIFVYSIFILTSLFAQLLTLFISIPLLAMVITLHSSLQHEVLHGHPFKNQLLSELTVFPALGLFIPYLRFKETHLQHHYDPNLTDPYDDPETNYFDAVTFEQKSKFIQSILHFNNALAGRMLIGPALGLYWFYKSEIKQICAGNKQIIFAWALHIIGLTPVICWLVYYTTMPLWAYLIAVYLGHSLLKVRTFLEHRAHEKASARSVIIEDTGLFSLLFLNNNFHSVHHAYPRIAWYDLPAFYWARREDFIKRNSGYVYCNYRDIFRRYFFRIKDNIMHPIWSLSNRTKIHK